MTLSQDKRRKASKELWADMSDDCESGLLESMGCETTARDCIIDDSAEALVAWSYDEATDYMLACSQIEPAPATSLGTGAMNFMPSIMLAGTPQPSQQSQILATTPVKSVLDLNSFSIQCDGPLQLRHHSLAPAPGVLNRRKLQNREITSEELARCKYKLGLIDPAVSTNQALTEASSVGGPDGEELSKQAKRRQKASKYRRDRYKKLVEIVKKNIEEDPNVEPASILQSFPAFVVSDDRLYSKLLARMQLLRQQHGQDTATSLDSPRA